MNRAIELKWLFRISFVLGLGFFILRTAFIHRGLPIILSTGKGPLDISDYFLSLLPCGLYGIAFILLFVFFHVYLRVKLPQTDPFILPSIMFLSGIGLLMMLRLSPDLAYYRNEAITSLLVRTPNAQLKDNVLALAQVGMKQLVFIGIGILAAIFTINLANPWVLNWCSSKKYFWIFLSVGLVAATLVFGTTVNGRRLWLFGFQTVEAVKLLVLLFMAAFFYEKGRVLSLHGLGLRQWLVQVCPFFVMWLAALIPLFIQKDMGPTIVIFAVFFLMLWWAGGKSSVTFVFLAATIVACYVSYKCGFPPILKERMDILLDPFSRSESMSRALWSLTSGGSLGSGLGYGTPYTIPEVQSDYNFTAICEELGLCGAGAVLILYAVLVYRCFRVAYRSSNTYCKALAASIGSLIGIQAFLIMAGNLGLLPMTGITLPFISYGGSSMLMTFVLLGIIMRLSDRCHE